MNDSIALVTAIHRAAHAIAFRLGQAEALAVTQAEAHVLSHLVEDDGATVTAVHEAFGHRRSTLTAILDRLEERGLVTREVNPDDRRSFRLRLTPAGRRLGKRAHQALAEIGKEMAAGLTARERAMLLAALDRMSAADPNPE